MMIERFMMLKTILDHVVVGCVHMGRNPISIRDVAQRSGVSIATVSNVLNNRCNVSDELRAKVLQAVKDLDYVANPIARSMRNSKTFIIGVIVVDLNCIFFAPMLKGIQNVTSKAGYSIITYDSNYDGELEKRYVRMMKNNLADGLIIAGLSDAENKSFYERIMREDTGRPFPIVSLENNLCDIGIDSVYIDNEAAALTAASHLIELGCRRILHIKAPRATSSHSLRCMGYRKALSQASRALCNAKIPVPEKVKIVGFDNTFISSIVNPSLTTINVPIYKMGMAAATQLLERLESPGSNAVSIRMDYELIIRRSTMASAQTNWDMVYW